MLNSFNVSYEVFGISESIANDLLKKTSKDILAKLITPGNKKQCINFLICNRINLILSMLRHYTLSYNDVFAAIDIYPEAINYLPDNIKSSSELKEYIEKNDKTDWYKYLDGIEFNLEIKDDNNGLLQDIDKNYFTLKDNFPINGMKDYYLIYKEYVTSGLSDYQFVRDYAISSLKEFRCFKDEMEKTFFLNDKQLREFRESINDKYYKLTLTALANILDGKLTFEDYLTSNLFNYDFGKINLFYSALEGKENMQHKLSQMIASYMLTNADAFHENFVNFMDCTYRNPEGCFTLFVKKYLKSPEDIEYIKTSKKMIENLTGHLKSLDKTLVYEKFMNSTGTYVIDEEVVSTAIKYANAFDIHISTKAIKTISKQLVKGEIEYYEEDISLDNVSSVLEYLELFRNKKSEKIRRF